MKPLFGYRPVVLEYWKVALLGIRLSPAVAFVACTPQPEETTIRNRSESPVAAARPSIDPAANGPATEAADRSIRTGKEQGAAKAEPVAGQGAIAATIKASAAPTDPTATTQGRRILSTAFVRMGPDGQLTLGLRDGSVLVLRDVVVRPDDYCGVTVVDGVAGRRYCGRFADIVTASPGGANR